MAAFMTKVMQIEIGPAAMPVPKPGEVLIQPEYVGICGSDVHFFESGQRKGKEFQLPFVLGHECAGRVAELGPGVQSLLISDRPLQVGDRVALEPQQTCGRCEFCKDGRYNLCPNVVFPSVPPVDGMLRTYFTSPAHLCFRLPDHVSTLEGALIEPLAVGLQAARRGDVGIGKTVAILGMGCIGLMTLLACKAMGASKIIAIDLYGKRLERALTQGATAVVNASPGDMAERVAELTDGQGADIVFETAGSPVTAAATVSLLKRGGVIVMVGNVNGQTPFAFLDLMYKEGEIRTTFRYRNNFATAIQAVATGAIDVKGIVSDIFPFSQTQQAFEKALNDRQNVIKAVVRMDG